MADKKNTRVSPARIRIQNAMLSLTKQMKYEDISITDIAREANVSRMTYYRLYDSKEAIMLEISSKVNEELFAIIRNHPDLSDYNLCYNFFQHFLEKRELVTCLYRANLFPVVIEHFSKLVDYLYEEIYHIDTSTPEDKYRMQFYSGGLFLTVLRWMENGMEETPDEMAHIILHAIHS